MGHRAHGYPQRQAMPGDRRVQALAPTTAGRTACEDMLSAIRAHEARVFSGLSFAEQATVPTLLRKIRQGEET